jgi:hypothetical protein
MRIVAPPFDSTSRIAGKPHAGENRSKRKPQAETIAEPPRIVLSATSKSNKAAKTRS